ncbi:adenylate/guanylate cyclase domain-containing protein [Mycolicibacterium agri]|uniref:Adenylate/guanylate cyclase domain-containing protein n=1 Tax=Mycolicibacterium agri TaxID=36811 RepID=A0A2A7N279_MYCAG|nr:adenylate/guanylate cyclase domain-containing protein [Mycolicibacterium agri]PEG37631.1 adenylate/guanylate cyclase domain-containing protein [Mycolicibacterium agri]GFG55631.1 putative adenylate cyclase [Mycolicibacterium agri]
MSRLAVNYAGRLAVAYLLSVTAAIAILIPLGGEALLGAQNYFTAKNIIGSAVLIVVGTAAVAVGGALNILPTLKWFDAGEKPNARQRKALTRLLARQSALLAGVWALSGAVSIILNHDGGVGIMVPTVVGVALGGAAASGIGMLLTLNIVRPILAAATHASERLIAAPGVLARLVLLWLLCSGLPSLVIVALIVVRANGWLIPKTASVEIAVLMVALAAVVLGLPTMILTSRSISDPISEVVDAMAEVEQGRFNVSVDVFERSEIGRLQSGFNRMVSGLAERERLRDLFGRHVGTNVARRAIEEGASMSGDVQEAAILFIDLTGSTALAASHPPQQVAEVLNDFFRIVVKAVDEHDGLINKFQGDAALAVFGAPLRSDSAASAALATSRALGEQLRALPLVDFGIGVSAGAVFAGNIGAENRYEYTVIGDAVNEAARLADLAKASERRILASSAAIERADEDERRHWISKGSEVLRGRVEATEISAPGGRQ